VHRLHLLRAPYDGGEQQRTVLLLIRLQTRMHTYRHTYIRSATWPTVKQYVVTRGHEGISATSSAVPLHDVTWTT
jgi:hypothetical protein